MAPIFLFVATLLVLGWLLRDVLFTEWLRQRVRRQPFPQAWRHIIRTRVPYVRHMPADLQLQLKKHMQVFLAEKPFIGCGGLEITDEMRVAIAAQACLLLLNPPRAATGRQRNDFYPALRHILVYPEAFVVARQRVDASGVARDQRDVLVGESWSQGQVILSWREALDGASVANDGRNVVLHEFAHQLDQENGAANGAPWLPNPARRARWAQVMGAEFAALQQCVEAGQESLLDPYAATDPAEFFAVATEVFFELPARLAAEHPALYRELSQFYRVDPLSW